MSGARKAHAHARGISWVKILHPNCYFRQVASSYVSLYFTIETKLQSSRPAGVDGASRALLSGQPGLTPHQFQAGLLVQSQRVCSHIWA
jgi:hypothetical protein